jgi:hypothetical protein
VNLCPSNINLRATETKNRDTAADNDNFVSEKFDLIDDGKIAHLKAIRANTPYLVSIRLFSCQNCKGQPQNYCGTLSNPNAEKKICESNTTEYVFFYVDKSEHEWSENKPKEDPVYMAAFARYPQKNEEIHKKIIAEVKKTAEWLGIDGSVIQCYVFYTTNSPCDTSDLGTLKKKYDEQSRDPKYFFQVRPINLNGKSRWLSINGGSPIFTIIIQEM